MPCTSCETLGLGEKLCWLEQQRPAGFPAAYLLWAWPSTASLSGPACKGDIDYSEPTKMKSCWHNSSSHGDSTAPLSRERRCCHCAWPVMLWRVMQRNGRRCHHLGFDRHVKVQTFLEHHVKNADATGVRLPFSLLMRVRWFGVSQKATLLKTLPGSFSLPDPTHICLPSVLLLSLPCCLEASSHSIPGTEHWELQHERGADLRWAGSPAGSYCWPAQANSYGSGICVILLNVQTTGLVPQVSDDNPSTASSDTV